MSWKEWDQGEVVEAGDFQEYIQDQVVQNYADSAARSTALGTAVAEGMVSYLQDSNSVEVYDGSAWVAVNAYQSHNYIINGAFDFWQRGTSFTNPSSGTYTADRWEISFTSATDVSQQTFTPADIEAIGFGDAKFFCRVAQDSTDANLNFSHKIEDVRTLAGQQVTLSFYAKSDVAVDMTPRISQNFGSGGSTTVQHTQDTISVTSSWARYSITYTLGSLSGKTIGDNSFLELDVLRIGGNASNINLDLWGVQLEVGSVATPFKRNANSIQGELAACQRYYYRVSYAAERAVATPVFYTIDDAYTVPKHPVRMRSAPTFSRSAANIFDIDVAGTPNINSNIVTADDIDVESFLLRIGFVSTSTPGYVGILYLDPAGYYELDAEL